MKLVLFLIIGLIVAMGLTYYFQPQLFHFNLSSIPSPNIVVTSPISGETVNPKFTITGFSKTSDPTVFISVLNINQDISIHNHKFSTEIDLSGQVRAGDQITLSVGPTSTPLFITLKIR